MCTRTLCFVVLFVYLSRCLKADDNFVDDVQQQCIQQCPLQNRTDDALFDCGYDCKIDQCAQGCRLWNRALESSCKTVCNGTQDIVLLKELYCVMGCNDAITRYFSLLRERIGTPPAPALVADSLTATSLSLKWDFPNSNGGVQYAGVRYLVQWRYEELSAEWQYCRNQTWGSQDIVFVDNLQPYTKYRFRVALLLSQHHGEPIVSEPSVVISTLSSGTPASPPAIVRAVAVDWSRISVSWEPGPFPNGPVLSYVLHISENHPHGYSALKDIPATGNNFYMFQNLDPSRNYTVTVAMRNSVGEGPAASVFVSTPDEPEIVDNGKPILILAGYHSVIQQGEDLIDEPIEIFKTDEFIKGLAIHVRKQVLFISDSAGYIYQTHLEPNSNSSVMLTPENLEFQPLDMSVDWLNEQLYILGEVVHSGNSIVWQITRCNLDGSGLTVAVAGLLTKPHHIEVDPYNGYLFWVIDRSGLYRLDLADISNGIKHEVQPDLILERAHLGAFTVDHTKFHLLVPDHINNTVYAVSLDGREIHDVRNNTQQPMFTHVLSIATANGLFYWTNGDQVLKEEHYQELDSYFHNAYPDLSGQSYTTVVVNLPSSQPIPVPVNPPTAVQAILGSTLAKTSWQVPHLLGGQGKGAWQNWSYEINIKDVAHSKTISHRGINTTSYTIRNLKENTEYVIKTAAYTSSGTGPCSSEFHGKTLRRPIYHNYPAIIWSASEGVLTSDVIGENVHALIHKSHMKDYYITDIAWYQNQLYLVSNTSQMYWYNMTNHKSGKFVDIDSVGSVAVDWIGKKIYWSNPKQQLIIRGNLNGTQQEPLPILIVAKELNIDSMNAYIYWSTGHAVECSRLNGVDRQVYHPAQLFSGKQVMGLTLDTETQMVYWIVRSYEGSTLYRERMAQHIPPGSSPTPVKVSNLQKPNMQGPLCYFSDHLLWLQDDKNAVIGDMNGQNTAVISGMSLSGLTMVSVLDPTVHEWPDHKHRAVNVIPDAVSIRSVHVFGKWNSFNITWRPINNTNYGRLFYEVKINDASKKDSTRVTTAPHIRYWKPVPPYTKLDVAIRAYTYWGSAPQIRLQLHSPASTPSAPKNARCYVAYNRKPFSNDEITILFRWDAPEHENGIINGYFVKCWFREELQDVYLCNHTFVESKHPQYFVRNLTENEVYYFQVQAFTHVGHGVNSNVIRCDTSEEKPLPVLLASSSSSIFIQDFDTHKNFSIIHNTNQPIDLSYMHNENRIFWLNEAQEIYMSNVNGKNRTKLLSITGRGTSISIDWVERCLYYVQSETLGSSIHKVDLNKIEEGLKSEFILSIPHTIVSLEVSPFTRKFYWIEINQDQKFVLMQADIDDNKNVEIFFDRNRLSYKRAPNSEYLPCNCPDHETINGNFAVDHTDISNRPQILFIDTSTQEILSADMHGCICNPVVNRSLIEDTFPIYSLTSDKNHFYWSSNTNGLVYYVNKNEDDLYFEKMDGQNFIALGSQMQPFPVGKCLTPKAVLYQVTFNSKTADSITINMPEVLRNDGCEDISLASVEYIIYYMPYNEEEALACDDTCSKLTTFEKTLKISGLRPFSKYLFSVAIKNYYSDIQDLDISPGVVYQTAAGAPSKPQDVTATVLNPTMVQIKWLPPQELNGEMVWYEIHSLTEVHSVRQKGEQRVSEENSSNSNEKYKFADLQKLIPNQTYLIWVRAYCENNETYTDSDTVQIQTFAEPNDIILVNNTAYSLEVFWQMTQNIEYCTMQYTDVISNQWNEIVTDSSYENITASIRELKPKMKYRFRLSLKYDQYSEPYIWPSDTRFVFETLGDRPSPPGMPIIGHKNGDIHQVSWEASKDNGAPIEMYNLEGRAFRNYRIRRNTNRTAYSYIAPSIEEYEENEWISFYNGTETYWIISGLYPNYRYYFRVSALNAYGWSKPSKESIDFNLNAAATVAEKHEQMGLILGISVPLLVTICVCVIVCFIYCVTVLRRKDKEKKDAQAMLANRPISPDVELATLRELPRRDNFIHNTNALYVSALPSPEELALLPQISRDQITLINFLGRGAFGEVYEGKARKIGSSGVDMKVAIKTLRKGATEQEKIEFLQEAQLMSHFKHEHILQLLGVCLDTHFIIMELMEGGDLLTYLRSNRKPQSGTDALTILDLLSMCVDVAKGCRYLEEMHFVHRDLACRNCLVSSIDRQCRVVKIGDFGLARDIYKNDYYRKEGEGLLPVRWMAPESLVDGVFTCQSDVWAFGVLMWEIMTLGQQPYPARNNLEVLHYVKGGGRLEKPSHCPEDLHKLMMDCWSYQQNNRPTFKYCLEILEELKNSTTDGPLTAVHSGNYVSTVPNAPNGVSNHAYFQDENHNSSGSSWKTENGDDANRDQVPLVASSNYRTLSNGHIKSSQSSGEIPKYLEIICDSCDPPFNDGYEIPRSSIRSNKSVTIENRGRTFSTSSAVSNDSVASHKNVSDKSGVQKTIMSSLKDKLLPSVQSNGESCNH